MKKTLKQTWLILLLVLFTNIAFSQIITRVTGNGNCINLSDTYEFSYDPSEFNLPEGQTPFWSTQGDLQIVSSTAETTVTVKSANRNPNYNADGYGKGRLRLNYESKNCGWLYTSYDLYKSFDPPYEIEGPQCVEPGEIVVFSYKPILTVNINDRIGTDSYNWDLSGLDVDEVLYYSGDSSSVTLRIKSLTGTDTIAVNVGQCNNGPGKTVKLGLNAKAPMPIVRDTCIAQGTQNIVLSVDNPVADVTYTWAVPSQFGTPNGNTGSSITVSLLAANSGIVKVRASYGNNGSECAVSENSMKINRLFVAANKINGNACVESGTDVTYTLAGTIPNDADLIWETPDGWNLKLQSQNTYTISPTDDAKSGNVKVTLGGCASSVYTPDNTRSSAVINVKPAQLEINSIKTCLAVSTGYNYKFWIDTSNVKPKIERFTWSVSSNLAMKNGIKTDTIYVMVKNNTLETGRINITPYGKNNCIGTATSLDVYIQQDAPQGIVNLNPSQCINYGMADVVTLQIANYNPNLTYDWSYNLPNDWHIANNRNYEVDIQTNGVPGTYSVYAYTQGQGSCSNNNTPQTVSTSVNIPDNDGFSIMYFGMGLYMVYSTTQGISSPINYTWELYDQGVLMPNGIMSVGDRGLLVNSSLGDLTNDTRYTVAVTIVQANGCTKRIITGAPLIISAPAPAPGSGSRARAMVTTNTHETSENIGNMIISPNPTSDVLNIMLPQTGIADIKIVDFTGKIVKQLNKQNATSVINVSDLPTGNYIIIAIQNGKRYGQQFIKQ